MSRLKDLFKKSANVQTQEAQGEEQSHEAEGTPSVPEGLWVKCPKCGELLYKEDVVNHYYICPKCGGYFRIKAKTRIKLVADKGASPSGVPALPIPILWTIPDTKRRSLRSR